MQAKTILNDQLLIIPTPYDSDTSLGHIPIPPCPFSYTPSELLDVLLRTVTADSILFLGDSMEFEPLFAESDVDDVEVLPEEHTDTALWYSQSNIEIQIPVSQSIIPEESELSSMYIYPEGDPCTS